MHGLKQGAAVALVLGLVGSASGAVSISQGTTPTTYGTTLTFDEVGGPTGSVTTDAFSVSHGVSSLNAGDGLPQVAEANTQPGQSWLGTGNVFVGAYGVFMNFDSDVTEFAAQIWDPSGPPSFFGGGLAVVVFDDGIEVGSTFTTPAWGGVGSEWFNITTTGGSVFDEIRILGYGFFPVTHMDNASWNAVPAPGAGALLCFAGLGAARRRRS